ncbi:MAG TPA: signal recognition particle protein [Bacteroidota bacterium]|nr:signal recognition particle protein [Bacteroidota bacterium]
MFQSISQKLEVVFKKLRGYGKITEQNIAETLRELRRVLLDADVNYKVAKQFIEDVQKRAAGQEVLASITPGQLIIKIVHDEMVKLLGESRTEIASASSPPTVILVAGLQGSGKTTFSAKLACFLKSKGHFPLLVAADVHRPAAIDQLIALGKQIDVPVYSDSSKGAVRISEDAVEFARKNVRDTVIIDTAGRMHVDEEMMGEISAVREKTRPHEILFVVDAMTGQDAVHTAKAFDERLSFDGIVLTKLDGDSKGGAALSIRSVVQKPIKFVGVGEKLDALEPFYPDRIASRILGMGDIVTLVEKAQGQFDHEETVKLEERLRKSRLTFDDFLEQLRQLKSMGSLSDVLGMIPGMSRVQGNISIDDKQLTRTEAIIQSMTKEERTKPSMINGSRRRRIALGSGTTVQEVNRLLKQFDEMQRMMKRMSKGNMRRTLQEMRLPTN